MTQIMDLFRHSLVNDIRAADFITRKSVSSKYIKVMPNNVSGGQYAQFSIA